MENTILNISIDLIMPNRFQPRLVFDEIALNELADSIKEHGIIEPIIVRPLNDKYPHAGCVNSSVFKSESHTGISHTKYI